MLTTLGAVVERADALLALSHSMGDAPRLMQWASSPLRSLLGVSEPSAAAELAMFAPSDRDAVERLYDQAPGLTVSADLTAYRPDGTPFRDRITVQRIDIGDGSSWVTSHEEVAEDTSTRTASGRSPAEAQSSSESLRLILRVSEVIGASILPNRTLATVLPLLVPSMATWVTIALTSPDGEAWRMGDVLHERNSFLPAYEREVRTLTPSQMRDSDHVAILRGQLPYAFIPTVTAHYLSMKYPPEAASAMAQTGLASLLIVPLVAKTTVIGLIMLARTGDRPPFTEEDLEVARIIGRRVGARIQQIDDEFERKLHSVSIQNALLPELAPVPGVEVRTVYRPSAVHAHVGGDWYDLFPVGTDRLAVAVGDVCGHDATAAATMARYRTAIRTFLWQGESPSTTLDLMDELIASEPGVPNLATTTIALIDRSDPNGFRLTYTSAGHLPSVALTPRDGLVILHEARATPVGVANPWGPRPQEDLTLPYDSTVVMFTDGVVERRTASLQDRIEKLLAVLAALPGLSTVDEVQDALIALNDRHRLEDDMCFIVARIGRP